MLLQKWDPGKHVYRPFNSPALKTILVTRDMSTLIDCAECGKEIEFGLSYTSRMIHTEIGFGYPVCEECYKKEKV